MNRLVTIEAFAAVAPGTDADVSFVPPIQRRRLSPLQKLFFRLARDVAPDAEDVPFVFASRDGEDTLTRRIVDDFCADGSVSPNRFSSSVYNAAPGLWSVFTGNRDSYTAIAAGDDTVECGMIEALGICAERGRCVFVCAEETLGGRGFAVRLGLAERPGPQTVHAASADGSGRDSRFDIDSFVLLCRGTVPSLCGRWIALSRSCGG